MTIDNHKKLVTSCQRGDTQAQEALYRTFSPKMMVVAMRYSNSVHEAEDILQEGFVKVFQKINTLNDHSKVEAWIRKVIVNTALNHSRSKLYMFPMVEVHDDSFTTDRDFGIPSLEVKDLLQLIQSLPDGCQIVFNMYAIEGFSHKEIAEELHISEGTSKSQLSRARMLLRDKLGNRKGVKYG